MTKHASQEYRLGIMPKRKSMGIVSLKRNTIL